MRFPALALGGALLLTACVHHASNVPTDEWGSTLATAQQFAGRGAYGDAERLLGSFQNRNAKSHEAAEAAFWRALYRSDPGNTAATTKDALAALDAYLALGDATHRNEATVLRRLVVTGDSLSRAADNARGKTVVVTEPGKPVPSDDAAEVKRLRDELAKANAELERIKKRLTAPKP